MIDSASSRAEGRGNSVNNHGEIVGYSPSGLNGTQAYLFSNGRTQQLIGDAATDINDRGQVVGFGFVPDQPHIYPQGFLWEEGKQTVVLNALCPINLCTSEAYGINAQGDAVGRSFNLGAQEEDGVLWQFGSNASLSEIAGGGWKILRGVAINDRGAIVALGINPVNQQSEAVLLSPTP